jgi:hypothetical protein
MESGRPKASRERGRVRMSSRTVGHEYLLICTENADTKHIFVYEQHCHDVRHAE